MRQFEAEILDNRPVAESWRELSFSWDSGAAAPEPGQFFTFKASESSDPLLRRPLAFSGFAAAGAAAPGGPPRKPDGQGPRRQEAARATAIFQARGQATRLLADMAAGSRIDIIGPLGRPFPEPLDGEIPVIAGGGIGLGPVLFLDSALRARGLRPLLVLGFRSSSLVPTIKLPESFVLCTDDGSSGFKGTTVDWISRNASESAPGKRIRLYACGPGPMLAALADLAAAREWPGWFSAEQWMACGVGACMGCALPRADGKGYLRACADGPVFDSRDIAWGAER